MQAQLEMRQEKSLFPCTPCKETLQAAADTNTTHRDKRKGETLK